MGLWDDFTDLVSDAASEAGALAVAASDPAGLGSDLFGDGNGWMTDLGNMIENAGGMDEILGDISAVIPDDPFVDFGNPWGGVQDTIGTLFGEYLPQDLGTLVADITGSGLAGGLADPMSFVTDQLGLDGSLVNGAVSWASDATGMDLDIGVADIGSIAGSVLGTAGGEGGFGADPAVQNNFAAVEAVAMAPAAAPLADAVVPVDLSDALGADLVDIAVTPSPGGPIPVPYPNTDAAADDAAAFLATTVPELGGSVDDALALPADGPGVADVTAPVETEFEPIPDAVDTAVAAGDQVESSVDDLFEGL